MAQEKDTNQIAREPSEQKEAVTRPRFDGITRGHFQLRVCATIRQWCVICERETAKFSVQVFVVRNENERNTNATICPDCLHDMPTHEEWRRLHDAVEAWDSAKVPAVAQ